jgi:hypothetical protein
MTVDKVELALVRIGSTMTVADVTAGTEVMAVVVVGGKEP